MLSITSTSSQLFIRNIFPERFPGLEPTFLFFDNACGLRDHIKGCVDNSLLDRVALVVDPFHFATHSVAFSLTVGVPITARSR